MRTSPQGFQFFGHNGSQKVLSSLSVVSVRVSSSYSRSSLKFFSSAGSIQEFSVLQVCCSLVFFSSHKKHSSSSSVRFFGSVFSALADFRFSRRVATDTLGKYSSLLCPFYFRGFSSKVNPNAGELQVGPVSKDKQEDGVIQVLQYRVDFLLEDGEQSNFQSTF